MSLLPRTLRIVTRRNRLDSRIDDTDGLALGGVDPLSYHLDGQPLRGDERWQLEWKDARWLFTSVEHRDAFAADPERWAPQFGGHCAVGRATGVWIDGDPRHWHLDDGKLYLNKNLAAHYAHDLLRRRIATLSTEFEHARSEGR
jgi:hypothetical protein